MAGLTSTTDTTTTGTTTTGTSPSTDTPTTLTADQGVWLALVVIVGMLAVGGIVIAARNWVKGDQEPPGSVIRSWIAVSLVMGLLGFCAAAFAINDTSLRSTLFGGLVTSVGAAVAFYFASKASDNARADVFAAMGRSGTPPTTFTNADPPAGTVGTPYSFSFTTDGQPPAAYAITRGDAPGGLTFSADGTLSGTPTAPGESKFAVRATNGAGTLIREDITVTVAA